MDLTVHVRRKRGRAEDAAERAAKLLGPEVDAASGYAVAAPDASGRYLLAWVGDDFIDGLPLMRSLGPGACAVRRSDRAILAVTVLAATD